MATFNNTQGSAAVQGNQVYGPYGNSLYSSGSMDTARGYTGQYADTLTGLDYYVSRYYDPMAGVFLSADVKEGNAAGMNPYAYVAGNPETMADPSGQYYSNGIPQNEPGGETAYVYGNVVATVTNGGAGIFYPLYGPASWNDGSLNVNVSTNDQFARYGSYNSATDPNYSTSAKFAAVTGWSQLQQSWNAPGATTASRLAALGQFAGTNINNVLQLAAIFGGPEDDGVAVVADEAISATEETATVAEEATTTAKDLYRQGGINAGPKLGNVRPGVEAIDDIVSSNKGTSLWSEMFEGAKPQGWWKLPGGTPIPDGYQFVFTHVENGVEHWEFRPIANVTIDAFQQAANSITGWIWMGKL